MVDATFEVTQLYGDLFAPSQVLYPENSEQTATFLARLREAKDAGHHVLLTDGSFDVPTDNHVWCLRECRRRAAVARFGGHYATSSADEKLRLIADDSIFMVVTLDADSKVAALKGVASKGGVARPVYPWASRASRLAGYMIPDGDGRYRPLVDLVVPEGDAALSGTLLASHTACAEVLLHEGLLDTWVVSGDHPELSAMYALSPRLQVVPTRRYSVDPRTGELWTSSYVTRRILDHRLERRHVDDS